MEITKDQKKRIQKLVADVIDINARRYGTYRLSLKFYQDRIELVRYYNDSMAGVFWDASFNSLDPEEFDTDLAYLEGIVAELYKKWRYSKDDDNNERD